MKTGATALLVLLGLVAFPACAQDLAFKPDNITGMYRVGEKVGWTATLTAGAATDRTYAYTIRKNGLEAIASGTLNPSAGAMRIETTLQEPAMVFVEVTDPAKPVALGAAVAPEKLKPVVPRPADFDAFWASKIRMLQQIPPNPAITPRDSGQASVDYFTVRMDHVNDTHVYGQLAKPRREGKYPGLVIFQWASPPYPLQREWVTEHAAKGWLALNIEPHDVLPDQPREYYDALPQSLKEYHKIGINDRDRNYFLEMYLRDYRAIEYLASRPDWDGKTLVVMGTSMGGQQSLCAAALNSRVTAVIVHVPAGADSNAALHGRASSYPNWPTNDPQIMKTALYFDTVNCAPRIKVPTLASMGFVDTTTTPAGIWTMFNLIRGPKEAVPMSEAPHNHLATAEQQRGYTSRSGEWLSLLAEGRAIKPPGTGNYAIQRADINSRVAHQRLLEKAKAGGTTVYFLGDSITRRWGAGEEEYQALLAHWKENFHGWNAGNFGWGGDTTNNILWRLENGELDGVNPRVIVLMAGTNNLMNPALRGDDDARVKSVTSGIRAILDMCLTKAPNATIVLMGVTLRNDDMSHVPVIRRINANLARFADGKRIRFIDLNDRLADKDGVMHEGMTDPDRLHLGVKAYQIWADALKPVFTGLLGPPAQTDTAPPPTSNPGL